MLSRPASRKILMPSLSRLRHSASRLAVLLALLVRIAYVPYHLAVDEHEGGHGHQAAHSHDSAAAHQMAFEVVESCSAHPAEAHGHEYLDGFDHEPAVDGGHPPHAVEDHDTELMQVRSSVSPAPLIQAALLEAETWRLVLNGVHVARSLRAPPLRDCDERGVWIARGPPATA